MVEIVRGADLLDAALAHADDAVGHRRRLDLVVRDEDRGDAELALQAADFAPHRQAQGRVEIRERLVEEKELRLLDEGAGERDALLLAARHLRWPPVEEVTHLHELRRRLDAAATFRGLDVLEAQREGDVFARRHVRVERVGLEDDADVAVARLDVVDGGAVEAGCGPRTACRCRRA